MLSLIIRGGQVIDGSGNPWYLADLGIEGDRIAAIGDLSAAAPWCPRVLDAAGKIVSPGFIDMHSHSDLALLVTPVIEAKIRQGITTEVIGQDGLGAAPMAPGQVSRWRRHLSGLNGDPAVGWEWRTFDQYLGELESKGLGHNVASYVPHGNVRLVVMGPDDRPATPAELARMQDQVRQAHAAGGLALSTGLIYPPCCYADLAELTALAEATAQSGGFLVSHIRNEGFRVVESLEEMIEACLPSGCPLHISHLKAAGQANWHKLPEVFGAMERARRQGLEVTFDQYPYTAGSTMLSSLLPPAAHAGGADELLRRLADPAEREAIRIAMGEPQGSWESTARNTTWDQILISSVASERNAALAGKSVEQVAALRGTDPDQTVIDLILEERNAVGMVSFIMCEDNVREIMRHPYQAFCTDGLLGGTPHPRAYGSYPRVLGRYVRELGWLELSDAIRRMTSGPAQRLGLRRRGLLRPGYYADVTVFDPAAVIDRATYEQPRQYPAGIDYVVVNGQLVVDNGRSTGAAAGRVLRRGREG